jgi:hypothetical protein
MEWHEDFRLTPGQMTIPVSTKKPRRRRGAFVMVPYPAILEVAAKAGGVSLAVMIGILFEAWKQNSRTVQLSGIAFELAGISRHARQRALRQLQSAGFVEIDNRVGGKSTITLLWQAPG